MPKSNEKADEARHWKHKVIIDEKLKQCRLSDGTGCAHQLWLMTRREKPKLSLLPAEYIIAWGSDKLSSLILFFYVQKVLLMESKSRGAHSRTICFRIGRESFCVQGLSLLIVGCGLFKDALLVNMWEDWTEMTRGFKQATVFCFRKVCWRNVTQSAFCDILST